MSEGKRNPTWNVLSNVLSVSEADIKKIVVSSCPGYGGDEDLVALATSAITGRVGKSTFTNLSALVKASEYDGFNPCVIIKHVAERAKELLTDSPYRSS